MIDKAPAVTPNGLFAYVINTGSNSVSEYTINSETGTLTALADGSCTGEGAVRAATPDLGNCVSAGINGPLSMVVSPNGKFAYVTNANGNGGGGTVAEYTIGSNGVLTPLDTGIAQICQTTDGADNCIATGNNPNSIQITPNGFYAYVTNGGDDTISEYSIGTSGRLFELATGVNACVMQHPNSPTDNCIATGIAPVAIAISPTGQYAYVVDTGNDSIVESTVSEYVISSNSGILSPVNTLTGGICDTDPSLALANCIDSGYKSSSITVSPNGLFAYVTNGFATGTSASAAKSDNTVSEYSIDINSGALTPLATGVSGICVTFKGTDPGNCIATGTQPYSVTLSPNGKFAYVSNYTDNTLSEYTVNGSGVLAPLSTGVTGVCETHVGANPENCVATGENPNSVAISSNSKFAYVANSGADTISEYSIDALTGALTTLTQP